MSIIDDFFKEIDKVLFVEASKMIGIYLMIWRTIL